MGRLLVIVPLREGALGEALALLRQGPPLDLEKSGVERYQTFLSGRQIILAIEGPTVGVGDGRHAWDDLSTWRNATSWQRCVESAPRLAEAIHSWERPPELAGVFFGPLPGPGDSEGGDAVGT